MEHFARSTSSRKSLEARLLKFPPYPSKQLTLKHLPAIVPRGTIYISKRAGPSVSASSSYLRRASPRELPEAGRSAWATSGKRQRKQGLASFVNLYMSSYAPPKFPSGKLVKLYRLLPGPALRGIRMPAFCQVTPLGLRTISSLSIYMHPVLKKATSRVD